jgi:hypothetical protein
MSTPRSVTITRSCELPPCSLHMTPPGKIEQGSSSSPVFSSFPSPPSCARLVGDDDDEEEVKVEVVVELEEAEAEVEAEGKALPWPRSPQLTLPPPGFELYVCVGGRNEPNQSSNEPANNTAYQLCYPTHPWYR